MKLQFKSKIKAAKFSEELAYIKENFENKEINELEFGEFGATRLTGRISNCKLVVDPYFIKFYNAKDKKNHVTVFLDLIKSIELNTERNTTKLIIKLKDGQNLYWGDYN